MYRPNYFYRGYAVHGMTSVPAYPASCAWTASAPAPGEQVSWG